MRIYHYILIGVVAVITFFIVAGQKQIKKNIKTIDEKEFKQKMPSSQIIDVRTSREFYSGHINGAKNIPAQFISKQYTKIKNNRPVLLYCASGKRSRRTATYLIGKGYNDIYELKGGLSTWNGKLK